MLVHDGFRESLTHLRTGAVRGVETIESTRTAATVQGRSKLGRRGGCSNDKSVSVFTGVGLAVSVRVASSLACRVLDPVNPLPEPPLMQPSLCDNHTYDRRYKAAAPIATAKSITAINANGAPGHNLSNPNPALAPAAKIPSPFVGSQVAHRRK